MTPPPPPQPPHRIRRDASERSAAVRFASCPFSSLFLFSRFNVACQYRRAGNGGSRHCHARCGAKRSCIPCSVRCKAVVVLRSQVLRSEVCICSTPAYSDLCKSVLPARHWSHHHIREWSLACLLACSGRMLLGSLRKRPRNGVSELVS